MDNTKENVSHPIFSTIYPRMQGALERTVGEDRRRQNLTATGRTLVIGAGTGLDVPSLENAQEVVLLEPDRGMRRHLAARYPHLTIWPDRAEQMSCHDRTFDTVLSSLVLCSVQDVGQVLQEVYRVLVPGGRFLFLEHVGNDQPVAAQMQRLIEPIWRHFSGGCHLTRPLAWHLNKSPLVVQEFQAIRDGWLFPIVMGHARKFESH